MAHNTRPHPFLLVTNFGAKTSPTDCFTKHGVERAIPIEALVKCKMQDNLEFLQWSKRYWDQYFPGIEYDPVSRRQNAGTSISAGPAAFAPAPRTATAPRSQGPTAARRPAPTAASNTGATRAPRVGGSAGAGAGGGAAVSALQSQNAELKESVAGLERERDFYFNKLREIEVLLQAEVEAKPELEAEEGGVVGKVQAILYSTEEGFEIPDVDEEGEAVGGTGDGVEEEETF